MSLRVDAPALAAVGLLLIFTSCTRTQTVEATSGREGAPAVPVAPVVRRDLSRDLELAAEFRPYQEVDLHAKVAGYLKAIHVEVGDRVHAGELIAELEAPEMAQEKAHASASLRRTVLEVERARGEVVRAEADLEIRRISYDRLAGVMKARPNLVARQEVDTLSARLRESQAQLGSAKAALAAVQEQVQAATATREKVNTVMSFLRIAAPFDGVVTRRMADPGEMIQAGTASHVQAQPVIRLSQIDRLRLVLPVPESVAGRVRLRGPVEVRIDSLQRVIQGRISRFTEKLDTATRTMETEVDIANPGHEIRPGMFGYARLLIDRRPDALSVPVQAVSGQHSKATVLVVNSRKRIEEREVDLGIETPDAVEVLGGLKEQELVVVGSRSRLKPGMTVEARRIEAPRGH